MKKLILFIIGASLIIIGSLYTVFEITNFDIVYYDYNIETNTGTIEFENSDISIRSESLHKFYLNIDNSLEDGVINYECSSITSIEKVENVLIFDVKYSPGYSYNNGIKAKEYIDIFIDGIKNYELRLPNYQVIKLSLNENTFNKIIENSNIRYDEQYGNYYNDYNYIY